MCDRYWPQVQMVSHVISTKALGKKSAARFALGTNKMIRSSGIGMAYVDDDTIQSRTSEFGDSAMRAPIHCGNAEREQLEKSEYKKDFDVTAKMEDRKNDKLLTCPPHIA